MKEVLLGKNSPFKKSMWVQGRLSLPSLHLPTFLLSAVFWAPLSRMLVSRSTSKDCTDLSLSMSGCTCLLQGSPIDTRCTGLPILPRICLAASRVCSECVGQSRESAFGREGLSRAGCQPGAAWWKGAAFLKYLRATLPCPLPVALPLCHTLSRHCLQSSLSVCLFNMC